MAQGYSRLQASAQTSWMVQEYSSKCRIFGQKPKIRPGNEGSYEYEYSAILWRRIFVFVRTPKSLFLLITANCTYQHHQLWMLQHCARDKGRCHTPSSQSPTKGDSLGSAKTNVSSTSLVPPPEREKEPLLRPPVAGLRSPTPWPTPPPHPILRETVAAVVLPQLLPSQNLRSPVAEVLPQLPPPNMLRPPVAAVPPSLPPPSMLRPPVAAVPPPQAAQHQAPLLQQQQQARDQQQGDHTSYYLNSHVQHIYHVIIRCAALMVMGTSINVIITDAVSFFQVEGEQEAVQQCWTNFVWCLPRGNQKL